MLADTIEHDAVHELAGFFGRHHNIVMLTGAGLSTASGIPDYRDKDGVRRGKPPIQGPEFRRNGAARKRYWARSMVGYPTLAAAMPNAGHHAIAALQARGRLGAVVTQNVDGLHRRAGSVGTVELHGSIHAVVCLDCGADFARSAIQLQLEQDNPRALPWNAAMAAIAAPDGDADLEPDYLDAFRAPVCRHCGGTLKPDVVFFGDGVPRACSDAAERHVAQADALLVVGSSVMVYSSFRLCRMAAEAGKPIAAINLGATRADALLALKIAVPSQHLLPLLLDRLPA